MIKNNLNFLKGSTFKFFFRSIIEFYFLKKLIFFSLYNDKNPRSEKEKIIRDIRNLCRLKE